MREGRNEPPTNLERMSGWQWLSALSALVCLVLMIWQAWQWWKPSPVLVAAEVAPPSRLVEVESGRTTYFDNYATIKDTATGAEYLTVRHGGIIKLEAKP